MSIGIYTIINKTNGKTYVGKSMNIEKRWKSHLNSLRNNTHPNYSLQKDFLEIGEKNFDMFIAKEVEAIFLDRWESLIAHEIDVWSYGYNMTGLIDYSDFSEEESKETCKRILDEVYKRTTIEKKGYKYYHDVIKISRELGINKRHTLIALRENIYLLPSVGDVRIDYCNRAMLLTVFYY